MIVEKIVNWFRNKGYDDFYLADLAEKHEGELFFLIFIFQCFILSFIIKCVLSPIGLLLPKSANEIHSSVDSSVDVNDSTTGFLGITGESGMAIVVVIIFIAYFLIFIPPILSVLIKYWKRKGETDLRITYIISSSISKFGLKAIRKAPAISTAVLCVSLIFALISSGFHLRTLIAFLISLLLLRLISQPYHKLLSRVIKEALYYTEWKTHQIVDNFDERYSGYEIWRIPPSEMDFEQFNVWHFRNICQTSFVSVSVGCLSILIYILSLSPICMSGYDKIETEQTEELYQEPSSGETEEVNSSHTDIEPEESVEPDVKDAANSNEAEDVNDAAFEEEAIEDKKETKEKDIDVNEKKNTEMQDTRHYHLNELDVQPTMNDGSSLKKGIATYLKGHITELKGNHVYVSFEISPVGKIFDVDASLVNDRELREKILNVLLSMPDVIPGKKDGHAVYVSTNITIFKE